MGLQELKDKLFKYNVPDRWYSLDGELKPDACILYENYSKWEFFYLNERGERLDHTIFYNAQEAYDYLWKKMEYQLNFFGIKPRSENS